MTFTEFNESKSGMVTRVALYPSTDIFPDEVEKIIFYHYIWLDIYSVWFKANDRL